MVKGIIITYLCFYIKFCANFAAIAIIFLDYYFFSHSKSLCIYNGNAGHCELYPVEEGKFLNYLVCKINCYN